MSDFTLWLYANYIRPNIDAVDKQSYEFCFANVERDLSLASLINFQRVLEFTTIQACLLGLRTGDGLALSIIRK